MTNIAAVEYYHSQLESHDLAAETDGQLRELQDRLGLNFGGRPLCQALRPRFMTREDVRRISKASERLLPAFERIYQRGLVDTDFRYQFRLQPWEEELLQIDPGFTQPSPTGRLDSFYQSDGRVLFTEYNSETPAGAGYSDALQRIFYQLAVLHEFQQRYHTAPWLCSPGICQSLLNTYAEWRGHRHHRPKIAILDWRDVPTYSEFLLFQNEFQQRGLSVKIIDPRELEYHQGRLRAGDFEIDFIYKRVLISELIKQGGMNHPVIQAVRDRSVCMANSFRCKMLFKKASLAVLSDEINQSMFTTEQQKMIAESIPWTRLVEARQTQFRNQQIDLIDYIMKYPEQFVLKPNDEYGGKGIVLGWTVSAADWEQSVEQALRHPTIVQERIQLPKELYPEYIQGRLSYSERLQDTNPYVADGKFVHGCLTRISSDELVNVTAGGGSTVPTILIEPRH